MAHQVAAGKSSQNEQTTDSQLNDLVRQLEVLIIGTRRGAGAPFQGEEQTDSQLNDLIRQFEALIIDSPQARDTPFQGERHTVPQLNRLIGQFEAMIMDCRHMAEPPLQGPRQIDHQLRIVTPSKSFSVCATRTALLCYCAMNLADVSDPDDGLDGLVLIGSEIETYAKCLEARRKRQEAREEAKRRLERLMVRLKQMK